MSADWVVVSGDFWRRGGMDRANFELARWLVDRGDRVHLVAHRVDDVLASSRGVDVTIVPRPLGAHALGFVLLDRIGARVARMRAKDGARVIVNGANCHFYDATWVHAVHHAWPVRDEGAPLRVRAKNRIDKWRSRRDEKTILRRARVVIANSEKTRRDLESFVQVDPARIHVVPLGCDPDADAPQDARVIAERRHALGVAPGELSVVFIGALGHDRNKGLDTLLEAWALLKRDRQVAGRVFAIGAAVPRWRAEIAARGLEGDVALLGARDDAGDILAAADLLVAPSRYDSYGLAVQEALCRHVPAITSSGSGVSERYPPSLARLVLPDPDDARALAERITWCARDRESGAPEIPREIARLGDEIRAHTWSRMSEEIVACVEGTPAARGAR